MNIVKYPGGKERELGVLRNYYPEHIENYYEPFVGGGAVYLDMTANKYFINDRSEDLMNLYNSVSQQDLEFFDSMRVINDAWKSINDIEIQELYDIYISYRDSIIDDNKMIKSINEIIKRNHNTYISIVKELKCGSQNMIIDELSSSFPKKFKRMKVLEFTKKHISDEDIMANIIGIFKAAFYMYIRDLYNHSAHYTNGFKAMLYLFIRDFCYSSMFRFNSQGEFNVPYGGISYNRKNYDNTIIKYKDRAMLDKMEITEFGNEDYKDFLEKNRPTKRDFMFVDPPYDSYFSAYDRADFTDNAQKELSQYLINDCECNFLLDIKYTDYIASLYKENTPCRNGNKLRVLCVDKNYSVSFMNRNNKRAQHMLIMNY